MSTSALAIGAIGSAHLYGPLVLRVSVRWRRILLCRCLSPLATLLGLAIVDRSGWNEVRDELRRIDRHARSVGYRRRRRSSRRIQRSLARALEALDRL